MDKHHIFCIHGLGKHDNDWVNQGDEIAPSFNRFFHDIVANYHQELADSIVLHAIHYDDLIERLLKEWETHLDAFSAISTKNPLFRDAADYFSGLADKLKQSEEHEKAWRSHLVDLLLFAGLPSIKDALLTYVGKQVINLVRDISNADDNAYFSVLSHSMGTAIAEKAIKALFNEGIDGDTLKGDIKLESITMVANTSFLLSRDKDNFYRSDFRPGSSTGAICGQMFSVNHKLDPVGRYLPFDPDIDWLAEDQKSRFHDIQLKRLSSPPLVHSLNHYFADPRFHVPYINMLAGRKLIKAEDERRAIKAFEEKTPLGKFKSMYSDLENLKIDELRSFKDFYDTAKALQNLLQSYKKTLEVMGNDH